MRWLWNKRAYATGGFGVYEVWVMLDWSLPGSLVDIPLRTQDYACLALFGAACIAITVWPWINGLRTSVRFRNAAYLIDMAMTQLVADLAKSHEAGKSPLISSTTRATMREMAYMLDHLNVPHPPLGEPKAIDEWYGFMPRVLAASNAGELKQARSLLREMRAEMERSRQDGGGA